MERMENITISAAGRHDGCIALRAAPVVEAAAALALCRLWTPEAEDNLAACRGEIDAIDGELVELLARRLEVGRRIGILKAETGRPIRDPDREAEVLRSRGDMAPEYRAAVEEVFQTIMTQTREVEK